MIFQAKFQRHPKILTYNCMSICTAHFKAWKFNVKGEVLPLIINHLHREDEETAFTNTFFLLLPDFVAWLNFAKLHQGLAAVVDISFVLHGLM